MAGRAQPSARAQGRGRTRAEARGGGGAQRQGRAPFLVTSCALAHPPPRPPAPPPFPPLAPQVSSAVATQPLLPEPRRVVEHYAASEQGEGAEAGPGQAYVGVNWVLVDEPLDVETELALGFLDYLMLVGGGDGAPRAHAPPAQP